jgi:hypothetical protein
MNKLATPLLVVAGLSVGLLACYGSGVSTGVYVGVGVPGPYVGYPGYGGYIGPPPVRYYDQDASRLPSETTERYARSAGDVPCQDGPKGTVECVSGREANVGAVGAQSDEADGGN